jgi:MFS transporter, DHA2 family, glioxin efflux transporter
VAAAIVFFFKIPRAADPVDVPLKEKILQLDLVGTSLMMGLTTSCALALQYGGQTHPWNSSVVIGLLVGFVAMTVAFVAWEVYLKERAIIVRRLVSSIVCLVSRDTLTEYQATKRYVFVGSAYMFWYDSEARNPPLVSDIY